jgi:hypothetical protein
MSAEVPKLHHRLLLEDPSAFGDRPPVEAVVLLADPAALHVLTPSSYIDGEPALDERSIAFPALSRFDFV